MTSTSATLAEPTPRLNALTGLRWWAAFMVFLYHMLMFAPLPGRGTQITEYGYLGVTFFFVLSGFVLTWSMRPGVKKSTFYWRRFARVWPLHMVALIVAIPIFYTLLPVPEGSFLKPLDLGILLLSVVVLQGWWANPVILFSGNPAAWTLTVEMLFYALHPYVSRVLVPLSRRGALNVAIAVVAWAFAYRLGVYLWPETWLTLIPMPITRLPEFVLGMALAWALRSGWRPRIHPIFGVGMLALPVMASMLADQFVSLWPFSYFINEIFTVAVALAIISLATHTLTGRRSAFESRAQVKLGEWSFAFYLIHATVIYLALRIIGFQAPSWRNLFWFAAILAIDIVLAWTLHRFLERPVEKRMRAWKDRRDTTGEFAKLSSESTPR